MLTTFLKTPFVLLFFPFASFPRGVSLRFVVAPAPAPPSSVVVVVVVVVRGILLRCRRRPPGSAMPSSESDVETSLSLSSSESKVMTACGDERGARGSRRGLCFAAAIPAGRRRRPPRRVR